MSTAGLSVLARLMRQGRFTEFETGESGPRTSPRLPAKRGFTRGTLGTMGSTAGGAATRNPDAAENRDRDILNALMAK
jgi:hypothetical protein